MTCVVVDARNDRLDFDSSLVDDSFDDSFVPFVESFEEDTDSVAASGGQNTFEDHHRSPYLSVKTYFPFVD